ncbi:hypothetical protein EV189_1669 [Motilibacter rhizosphaerae]|uniref:Uncharacterized protein n=1 Tax=Motilibacter rhizosphaerae TaxID=598652 RepID=A0A4Q7NS32_9ACTN|nr:hypothetical protein [Motilibacter rhizosphaerae]RZS89891.1 hypothetical protein EV189_1669 [Motilibacter rhizosphaerae]
MKPTDRLHCAICQQIGDDPETPPKPYFVAFLDYRVQRRDLCDAHATPLWSLFGDLSIADGPGPHDAWLVWPSEQAIASYYMDSAAPREQIKSRAK